MTAASRQLFVRDRFTWLAYLMLAYYAYLQASLGPLMPFLRAELGLSYTVGGLHFSAFALGMVAAGVIGASAARRFGRKTVFWGGGIGMALGALWLIIAGQVVMTIAASFVMGWMGTMLLVIIQAGLSDRHGQNRAIALTESNVGASMAAMLVPLFIAGFQQVGLGWRVAIALAIVALIGIALRFRGATIPAIRPSAGPFTGPSSRLPAPFWAYWAVLVLSVAIEWSLVFWGADFLANVVGLSRTAAAATMSVYFLAMVLGRFTGSRLTRRLTASSLLMIALGVALIGFLIFWLAPLTSINVAGLFIAGFGVANLFPMALSVATGVAADQADRASARLSVILFIIAAAVTTLANRIAPSQLPMS
jgi:MFS family permease